MPTFAIEGVGATIAFASSDFTADLISLTMPESAREQLDTSHLGTVGAKTSKPAKLKDVGQVSCEFDHQPEAIKLLDQQPEVITVSYPLLDGQTTPTKLVFTGYAINEGGEEMKIDAKMSTKVTLKVTGDIEIVEAT